MDIKHIGIKALPDCLLQPGWIFSPFLPGPLFIYKSCEVLTQHLISIQLDSKLTFFSRSLCSCALGLCQALHIFNLPFFFPFQTKLSWSSLPPPP